MKSKFFLSNIVFIFSIFCSQLWALSIRGTVIDAQSTEPIPYASVLVVSNSATGNSGTLTDEFGAFTVNSKKGDKIIISYIGYNPDTITVKSTTQIIRCKLTEEGKTLNEVVVTTKRYHNKNNPAVELVRRAIHNKSINNVDTVNFSAKKRYEKFQFAFDDITPKMQDATILKSLRFLWDNTDTTKLPPLNSLTFYLRENVTDVFDSKNPKKHKENILAEKMVEVKNPTIDNKGLVEYSKHMYTDINVLNEHINFLTTDFLSPMALSAPSFYRYYIMDTVQIDGVKAVKLLFAPRNKEDLLFTGHLYITPDSVAALKRIEMEFDHRANINWVKMAKIRQDFAPSKKGGWHMQKENTLVQFYIIDQIVGILGEREISFEEMDSIAPHLRKEKLSGLPYTRSDSCYMRDENYWQNHRQIPLTPQETRTYQLMDTMQNVPLVNGLIMAGSILGSGYIPTKYVEFGTIYGIWGHNNIEGHRVRFGLRTTPYLTKRILFEGYAAYSFRSKFAVDNAPQEMREKDLWNGFARLKISLTPNDIYTFPRKYIGVSYYLDQIKPGQTMENAIDENTVFSSIGNNNIFGVYRQQIVQIEHLNEFNSNFSYLAGFRHVTSQPLGNMYFTRSDYPLQKIDETQICLSTIYAELRYAHKEKRYQGKKRMRTISNRMPVFTLWGEVGNRAWGNNYNYGKINLQYKQRIYLSFLGYVDVNLSGGFTFGQASFPALFTATANQSYVFQKDSYNLMNHLEFLSDRYVQLFLDYNGGGVLFNKIPFIKYLDLREVVTLRLLYGGLSDKNNPAKNPELFRIPTTYDGVPVTNTLEKMPYIEASFGISNILHLLRIDYVHRFTYRNNPGVAKYGIRFCFEIDF